MDKSPLLTTGEDTRTEEEILLETIGGETLMVEITLLLTAEVVPVSVVVKKTIVSLNVPMNPLKESESSPVPVIVAVKKGIESKIVHKSVVKEKKNASSQAPVIPVVKLAIVKATVHKRNPSSARSALKVS